MILEWTFRGIYQGNILKWNSNYLMGRELFGLGF
jgi:hypothetical protein